MECPRLAGHPFKNILLVCEINAMVQLFEHMRVSPFFGSRIYIYLFQSVGHSLVSHIFLQSVVIILIQFSPAVLTSSIRILSTPGYYYYLFTKSIQLYINKYNIKYKYNIVSTGMNYDDVDLLFANSFSASLTSSSKILGSFSSVRDFVKFSSIWSFFL